MTPPKSAAGLCAPGEARRAWARCACVLSARVPSACVLSLSACVLSALLSALLCAAPAYAQAAPAPARTIRAQQLPSERPSAAASVRRLLERGHELYRQLDFPGCVEAMQRALDVPGVLDAHRLEAYETMGAAFVVLDREADAAAAFRSMFEIDPYHRVREPSGSPKIERFVENERRSFVPDAALDPSVELHALLPRAARVGRAFDLRVQVRGSGRRPMARLDLFLRGDEETVWRSVRLSGDGFDFAGEVEVAATPGALDLYVQARDAQDRVVARAGEPLAPLVVELRERLAEDAFYRKWWFWTLVGVVVVGAAVGIGIAVRGGENAPNGTLPPFRVELP